MEVHCLAIGVYSGLVDTDIGMCCSMCQKFRAHAGNSSFLWLDSIHSFGQQNFLFRQVKVYLTYPKCRWCKRLMSIPAIAQLWDICHVNTYVLHPRDHETGLVAQVHWDYSMVNAGQVWRCLHIGYLLFVINSFHTL
jgi:hypothetical protein